MTFVDARTAAPMLGMKPHKLVKLASAGQVPALTTQGKPFLFDVDKVKEHLARLMDENVKAAPQKPKKRATAPRHNYVRLGADAASVAAMNAI